MTIWKTYLESEVLSLVKENLESKQAKKLGLEIRMYQITAAIKCYEKMAQGSSVVLNLPTGTGKTMVANILTLMILENNPDKYCLYIAPTRSLAWQHAEYSKWLAPRIFSCLFLEKHNSGNIQRMMRRSRILISTPRLCANLIRSLILPQEILENLCFVSIDEFDDAFVLEYDNSGVSARLSDDMQILYSCLPHSVPSQLISATDPKLLIENGNSDLEISAYSKLMDKLFEPQIIKVDPQALEDYMPTARIIPILVIDDIVKMLSTAITVEMSLVFDEIFLATGHLLDRTYVIKRLESILNKRLTRLKLLGGEMVDYSDSMLDCFSRLRYLMNCHEHLYEDMMQGFDFIVRPTEIFSVSKMEFVLTELPRLIDNREGSEFTPCLKMKADTLCDILLHNIGRSAVVFTRKKRLSNALLSLICTKNRTPIEVYGELNDKEQDRRISAFRAGEYDTLIITRGIGRRGLDLPEADFSIFYNPKSRETTTWQELSRIRSAVHSVKKSYFLCYDDTADSRRMEVLITKMKISGREYQIDPSVSYGISNDLPTNNKTLKFHELMKEFYRLFDDE